MRLLLVEDDDSIAKALEKVLNDEHYVVDIANDGQMGWQLVEAFTYDLIVLDVVLPKLDGIQFCRQLRSHHYQTPVLLLTAQRSSAQRVIGLDAGADDYVIKPFEMEELLARIRVLLRRGATPVLTILEWENLRLNPNTREVTYQGHPLYLTPKEYRILELFLRKQHYVFSRNDILESLWTINETPSEDTVTAHIKGLRQKLRQAGAASDLIETVYGVGYRLKPLDAIKAEVTPPSTASTATYSLTVKKTPHTEEKSSIQQQTKAALAEVWQKSRKQNTDRLAVLKQASRALLENTLTDRLQQQAQLAAHKLAGALGVFGFIEGSRLAADIEQQFANEQAINTTNKQKIVNLIHQLEQELQDSSPHPCLPISYQAPILLLVDHEPALAAQVIEFAKTQNLTIHLTSTIEELKVVQVTALKNYKLQYLEDSHINHFNSTLQLPDVILLNLTFKEMTPSCLKALTEVIHQPPPMPVLVCTANNCLANRVKAAELGAYAFLHQPTVKQTIEMIKLIRSRLRKLSGNILIVDDDPQVLSSLRTLLEPWGLTLTTLEQPPQFWDTLEACSPDLLVLDVEMPEFNGIDLCRVVRHTPAWQRLPILFLTVHTDPQIEHQAFTAGANDFINKSLAQSELLTRILGQLERSYLQQTLMTMETNELRPQGIEKASP
ncbi:response regulator [Thermocoleostomius sinensis]|jgi:DNA-binding response OmpR family regulator|uniref:Response regulator n=1 Tax=Thermocoleostomius sinensis A174 TaxID=2016057 RepID=A0A9E8ZJR3_9CYAN|nr:response regulator [Thermocoleostomius sinensis]WAL59771.1 response regulator [Thermocoleostomius sinensis A174]